MPVADQGDGQARWFGDLKEGNSSGVLRTASPTDDREIEGTRFGRLLAYLI